MNKRERMLEHLDLLIKELHWLQMQEGWKNKDLAEAMVHLIQARAILTERRERT